MFIASSTVVSASKTVIYSTNYGTCIRANIVRYKVGIIEDEVINSRGSHYGLFDAFRSYIMVVI